MNLYNREGLPASPFRSDDWPLEPFGTLYDKHFLSDPGQLVRLFGYPGDLESLAVAKVLAERGKFFRAEIKALLEHKDPDDGKG